MPYNDATERARLRRAILRHLRTHPHAGDTVEGILGSWLPRRGHETAPDHIEAVLAELVASGRLQAEPLPGGKTFYFARG